MSNDKATEDCLKGVGHVDSDFVLLGYTQTKDRVWQCNAHGVRYIMNNDSHATHQVQVTGSGFAKEVGIQEEPTIYG